MFYYAGFRIQSYLRLTVIYINSYTCLTKKKAFQIYGKERKLDFELGAHNWVFRCWIIILLTNIIN